MKTVQIDLKGKQNKAKTLPHPEELSVFQYISDTPTMLISLLFFYFKNI